MTVNDPNPRRCSLASAKRSSGWRRRPISKKPRLDAEAWQELVGFSIKRPFSSLAAQLDTPTELAAEAKGGACTQDGKRTGSLEGIGEVIQATSGIHTVNISHVKTAIIANDL